MSNLSTEERQVVGSGHEPVEVRTDARVAAAVGGVAAAVAICYLARVGGGGSWLDWAMLLVTGAIAAAHLQSLFDARVPLLVVDDHGARIRTSGGTWLGLPWSEIERIEQRGEVRHGHQRHQGADRPVQRGPRVHGAGEVRRRHGAREHADEGGHAGPPTYLDGRGLGRGPSLLASLLGQLLGRHRCRQRPELGRHVELDQLVVAHRQVLGVVLVHSSP